MKQVNLEEIFKKTFESLECHIDYDKNGLSTILLAMQEACNQTVDLCAENADTIEAHQMCLCEECGGQIVDIQSILDTKKQII